VCLGIEFELPFSDRKYSHDIPVQPMQEDPLRKLRIAFGPVNPDGTTATQPPEPIGRPSPQHHAPKLILPNDPDLDVSNLV
jgi:hypothetical protein